MVSAADDAGEWFVEAGNTIAESAKDVVNSFKASSDNPDYCKYAKPAAIGALSLGGLMTLIFAIPTLLGFEEAGIAAESFAALVQSGIGDVEAGSLFAWI